MHPAWGSRGRNATAVINGLHDAERAAVNCYPSSSRLPHRPAWETAGHSIADFRPSRPSTKPQIRLRASGFLSFFVRAPACWRPPFRPAQKLAE